jgi:hypothetical protein
MKMYEVSSSNDKGRWLTAIGDGPLIVVITEAPC